MGTGEHRIHEADQWAEFIQFLTDKLQDSPSAKSQILWALDQARRYAELKQENEILRHQVSAESAKRELLMQSALELSDVKDVHVLCGRILTKIRELTHAEGGSLYLVNKSTNTISFSTAQNEKVAVPHAQFSLPIDNSSMAGACAYRRKVIHVPDVSNIPEHEGFKFNRSMDEKTGYVTRCALCIPLMKTTNECVGVIQLLNSTHAVTFTDEDIEFARALSGHIAVALETAILYQEIEHLFEGFIQASVTAIESRDPVTSGHSERVAQLTVGLAQVVSESSAPVFRGMDFDEQHLKELRYAALLHDFGKIGVPESVLLKEKKLYPEELKDITHRITILKLAFPEQALEFEAFLQKVLNANEPKVKAGEALEDLSRFLEKEYEVFGQKFPLLRSEEWKHLSISKGSLTPEDRKLIESHVTHTYRFLRQIPWSKRLSRVPDIAHAHHEKLDGTGYPRGVKQLDIPFESQMMAIADIYDALTSPDRPYKKSVPESKAFEILMEDAAHGKLNSDLVLLFRDQRVPKFLK